MVLRKLVWSGIQSSFRRQCVSQKSGDIPSTVPFENDNRKYILLINGPKKDQRDIQFRIWPAIHHLCGPPTCFLQRLRYWLQRQFSRFLCSKSRVWFPQEWQVLWATKIINSGLNQTKCAWKYFIIDIFQIFQVFKLTISSFSIRIQYHIILLLCVSKKVFTGDTWCRKALQIPFVWVEDFQNSPTNQGGRSRISEMRHLEIWELGEPFLRFWGANVPSKVFYHFERVAFPELLLQSLRSANMFLGG